MNIDEEALVEHQKSSTELVVYSRLAEKAVTVSWPQHNGNKIQPHGLKLYLRARGLFLECFCGFQSDRLHPKSCQIVVSSVTEDIFGFCHHDSPRCAFKNSSQSHERLQNMSFEVVVPAPSYAPAEVPLIWRRFWLPSTYAVSLVKILPLILRDILGNTSFYPAETRQLSGTFLLRGSSSRKPKDANSPCVGANHAIAGPSSIPMDSVSAPLHRVGDKEGKYLRKLMNGEGISAEVWDGLVETCTKSHNIQK
ncbi:hypothetical protein B0H14DRAFT_2607763 [Mycena olivaceomarginata]|nr:hypothetical protein B0H14DRAFT_2607763 [Mycena olivaceomarginata]